MNSIKMTIDDIQSVKDIEGFPIASDEAIIEMADAPFYTPCPNPYIREFLEEYGTKYDEKLDTYKSEPFSADINEGKYDPIYKMHPYHTKVPHQAIMKYIKHYTKPGDVILDGFAGTGMTGIAAQMVNEGEGRHAILMDLAPAATFISAIGNGILQKPIDVDHFMKILEEVNAELGWMYKTKHEDYRTLFGQAYGDITSVIWSDVYICPVCGEEFAFWDEAVDYEGGKVLKEFKCPKCQANNKKSDCEHAKEVLFCEKTKQVKEYSKQIPVIINYTYAGKRYDKKPDSEDFETLQRIQEFVIPYWFPTDDLPKGINTEQPINSHNFSEVDEFYFRRSLAFLAAVWSKCKDNGERGVVSKVLFRLTKRYALTYQSGTWGAGGGPTPGTLFIPALVKELNIIKQLESAIGAFDKISQVKTKGKVLISTQSSTDMRQMPDNCIDYIFTDPPFGNNINYSELNIFWESWLRIKTNSINESIVNDVQGKGVREYLELIQKTFKEYFRVLKPNRWITVEFHNSQNSIWNAIQTAIAQAGFVIADVRVLSKGKESFKQIVSTGAVKQDLVISAYKPYDRFRKEFSENAGKEETAWDFVRLHLEKIPVVVVKNDKIEVNAERQGFLLFDRMVAYHIMNGLPVPIDASDFYRGLEEKFLKRDEMYFLPDQVNEYDTARIKTDVEPIQFSLFVTNEKTAISWLYQQLSDSYGGPQTYAEIQPKFLQEVKAIDRYEAMPELQVILEENFLQDDKGRWYVPDVAKEGDVAKLREKKLLKDFEGYINSKGKLKSFRSEAIRVGFSKLWKEKNYKAIVDLADRLPESTVQEDPNILMYYDISLSRV